MLTVADLINDIKRDEGYSATAYRDTRGLLTIGYGFLIDEGGGLLPGEGDYMLANRLSPIVTHLNTQFPWFQNMDGTRCRALANMAYQLGFEGLLKFETMLKALANGNYNDAALSALDSLWARQTPNRAARIANMLAKGDSLSQI